MSGWDSSHGRAHHDIIDPYDVTPSITEPWRSEASRSVGCRGDGTMSEVVMTWGRREVSFRTTVRPEGRDLRVKDVTDANLTAEV